MEPPLEPAGYLRQREAEREVDGGHDQVDGEGTEGGGWGELALAGELDEADDGGQRGVLDELDQEADGGRNGEPERLRHDDVAQLLGEAQAQRGAGLPLGARDGLQAAAPDLAQKGAGIDRIRRGGGDPRRDGEAEDRQGEEEYEQPGEQGRALHDQYVDRAQPAQRRPAGDAQQRDRQADQAAAHEGDGRQRQGPARGRDQVEHVDEGELADHRRAARDLG